MYYHRRVVPEDLRPYFTTKTGKPRTEFKTSLKTKIQSEANERLELEDVRIAALFKDARRLLEAGIGPKVARRQSVARDDWEQDQRVASEAIGWEMTASS